MTTDAGRFGQVANLFRLQNPAILSRINADQIGRTFRDDLLRLPDRKNRFVGHDGDIDVSADFGHAVEVPARRRLLYVFQVKLAVSGNFSNSLFHRPASVHIDIQPDIRSNDLSHGGYTPEVLFGVRTYFNL